MDELSDDELWELAGSQDKDERAQALLRLAVRMQVSGSVEESLSQASSARELFIELGSEENEARSGYYEARAHFEAGNYAAAIAVLERTIDLYRVYASEVDLAAAISLKAKSCRDLKHLDQAKENFSIASNLYASNGSYTAAGICALEVLEIQGREGHQTEALATGNRALEIFRDGSDLIGVGRAHDRIAASLIDLGDIYTALEHLREALRVFTYIENEYYSAWANYRLGWALVTVGQNAEAIPLLETASRWYKDNENYSAAADADTQLAHALANEGKEEQARELYLTTKAIYAGTGRPEGARLADGNIAASLARSGMYTDSIKIYRRLIDEGREVEDGYLVRAISTRLANCLVELQTFETAEEALRILDAVPVEDWGDSRFDRVFQLDSYMNTNSFLGRVDEVERYAKAILEFGIEAGFISYTANAYKLLGLIEFDRGNEEGSNALIAQAIALYLADGSDETARELSNRLLPTSVPATDVLLPENGSNASPEGRG
jgi:tetratricopeptide (TPR) repeat protein